ncbi:hypothetical protein CYQ88_10130, partial [Hydrogenovibrio sp. SC-1]|uniref:hypothetical protein n=1 Tax=Hydrogenovibrio sp. SC-1 TaxID=2065820 RepID=UPI000CC38145
MKKQQLKKIFLSVFVALSLFGCSTTEDRLRQCQAEYKDYQQRVEKFYQQEIDNRVGAIKEENIALKMSISEKEQLINNFHVKIKKLELRIEIEESAVSHFKYCQLWGDFAFFCDVQKSQIGALLFEKGKITISLQVYWLL